METLDMSSEWIKELKKGDKVIVSGTRQPSRVATIERFTKTQIIVDGGSKFRLSDGEGVGGSVWCYSCIDQATDEAIAEIKEQEKVRKYSRLLEDKVKFSSYTGEQLEQIFDMFTDFNKENTDE